MKIDISSITIPKDRMRQVGDVSALAESMEVVGLLNPVVVTKDDRLVAGLHRLTAAKKLGWTKIDVKRIEASELEIQLAEIDENLIRNELTVLDRAEHLLRRKEIYEALHPETKKYGPGRGQKKKRNNFVSFSSDTSKKTSKSRRTIEQEVKIAKSIDGDVKKKLRGTKVENRKSDLLKISRMTKADQRKVCEKIAAGAKSVKEAKKEIIREVKTPTEAAIQSSAKSWRLIHAECKSADIDSESVDCIITDPPYPKEFLKCYSDLAELASRVLKVGGSCVVMCGQSYLPEIINRMSERLEYRWTIAYLTPGGQSVQLWDRKVNTFWKPLLWFVKPPCCMNEWQGDVIGSKTNDNDKRFHDWGQSESGMASVVERFTFPGQTILDPFVGGGTTGVVCLKLGRLFVGCDLDERQIQISSDRLRNCV